MWGKLHTGEDLHRRFILRKPKDDPDNLPAPFPGPITLGDALTNFADLTSSPLKSVLPALAAFASSEVSSKPQTGSFCLSESAFVPFFDWHMFQTTVSLSAPCPLWNKVDCKQILSIGLLE